MDNRKRIKQDCDVSSLCSGNRNISTANDSSRQGIFTESTVTFDNCFWENESSKNAITTQSNQGKASLFLCDEETALSVLGKSPLSTSVNQRCNSKMWLLPGRSETEKPPVLRKIRTRGTGSTNGFALDHGHYPKLVGVQSISSKSRISISPQEAARHFRDMGELSKSVRSLIEFQHDKQLYSQVGAQPVANTPLTSLLPATQINCKSGLELNHNQKNGKSDMCPVTQDKVFLVQRNDLDGESFLVHSDNTGKASILAKFRFPTFVKGESSTNTGETSYPEGKRPLRTPCETSSALLSALKSAKQQQLYQRTTVTPFTKDTVAIKPVETDLLQIPVPGKTHNRTPISGECSMRQTSSEITRLLQDERNRISVGHSKSQAMNDNNITDNTPRCNPSDLQTQRLKVNSLVEENPRLNQSQVPFTKPKKVAFREPQLDPQVRLNENQGGNEISRDTVQRLVNTSHIKKLDAHKTSLESLQNLRSHQLLSNQNTRCLLNGQRVAFTACKPQCPHCHSVDEKANTGSKTGNADSLSSSYNGFPAQTKRIGHSRNRQTEQGKELLFSQPHPSFTSDPVENKRTDATKTILRLLDSWKRLHSQNDSLQIKHLLVGSHYQELSDNKNTTALRASEIDSYTMGRRVLNDASDSITSDANVLLKEKEDAQTDSYRAIYVDETSLTKPKKRHVARTTTQSNEAITTLNESLSQSACYVPISSSLSLSLVGRSCSQICSTKRKNTVTFLRNGAERSFNSEAPPEQTPTYHKQYGPYSTTKEVQRRNSPRYMGWEAPTRGQQRKNDSSRINTRANEIVEIVIDPTPEPVNQIKTSDSNAENIREDTRLRDQGSDTESLSQRTLPTSFSCDNDDDDDDDLVEVIIPKPKRHCPLRLILDSDRVNEIKATSSHDNFGNDELRTKQTVQRDTAETVNVATEHNFRSEITKEKYVTLETNQMNGAEEGQLQTIETDEAIEEQTQLYGNEHGFLHKTIVNRDSRAENDSEVTSLSSANDYSYLTVSDTSTATDVDEQNDIKKEISLLVQNDRGADGVKSAQNDGKEAVSLKVEHKHKKETVLKTARDQLEEKIRKTRQRIVQEDINWKKKYLQKLETLLEKKLTKIGGESGINDDFSV